MIIIHLPVSSVEYHHIRRYHEWGFEYGNLTIKSLKCGWAQSAQYNIEEVTTYSYDDNGICVGIKGMRIFFDIVESEDEINEIRFIKGVQVK